MNDNKTDSQGKEKKKMSMYIFPVALILLDVGAAIMCIIGKDYKRARVAPLRCSMLR